MPHTTWLCPRWQRFQWWSIPWRIIPWPASRHKDSTPPPALATGGRGEEREGGTTIRGAKRLLYSTVRACGQIQLAVVCFVGLLFFGRVPSTEPFYSFCFYCMLGHLIHDHELCTCDNFFFFFLYNWGIAIGGRKGKGGISKHDARR